jgi:hypothetical protein
MKQNYNDQAFRKARLIKVAGTWSPALNERV